MIRPHNLAFLRLSLVLVISLIAIASSAQVSSPAPIVSTEARWNGQSRYTILIMGIDRRPNDPLGFNARMDAIMLLSFDPVTARLGVLSIPRDLFFALPQNPWGGDLVRVNTLLIRGEETQALYGPYLAMDTLQANFGMYVDAYVLFDFEGFSQIIDALGGIEVNVPASIRDTTFPNMTYGYDPLILNAGRQWFDGATALRYARTRHGDSDYVRVQRQLDVLLATRQRLEDDTILQRLITQAPTLLAQLQGHVLTNLPPDQIIALGLAMRQIPPDQMTIGAINQAYVIQILHNGQRIDVPNRDLLAALLSQVFGTNYAD